MQQSTPKIEILLEEVVKRKASDLHLQVGLPPMLRVDGVLTPVQGANKLDQKRAAHIITGEDPMEYIHPSAKSLIVQREVHYDTFSFSAALRSALREDPDVVMIGEMRDLETIAAAITIAETGHLVLATLHTNSASQSIDRMIDVFPPHQQPQIRAQLANILMAICSQRLLPAIGGGRLAAAELLV